MAALTISRQIKNMRLSRSYLRGSTGQYIKESGLYGFDHLKTASGFNPFANEAIQRCGELINYISRNPSSNDVITAMDQISDTICSVIDSAELCRCTHPDREFVEEANKASMKIHEYLHFLNTNHTLYDAVKKAEKDSLLANSEAQRAAAMFAIDFEKGGIHLTDDKLDRVNDLNMDICQLCREYTENITNDPGCVDIFPASSISKSLRHLVKPIYRSTSSSQNTKEKGYRIITDPNTLSSVLNGASDSEVRKMVYIKGHSVPSSNLGVLEKLISARHELAQILGYKSYAEFVQHPNMATSPDVVMPFLLEMSDMVRPMADKEFKRILDFKRERSGQLNCDLEPWDETYFTGLMKSSACGLDSSVVASYFPLSQCIEGLKLLVESLFGLTFKSIPLAPGESWHPDVLKMSLFHCDKGDLGYLYLDLNPRKGKYPGCAHFAIRGGRRISETDYQLPIIALVCNFTGSRNSAVVKLNHGDVETLFHEFGHALHSLLSQTDYQHFSGTRVALDLAETPSNLFEYYAWDYRVLKTFARHYSTGEIIPEKLVESMQGAKKMFAATELQRQIFYALIDQAFFGEQPASQIDTISIVRDLKRQHTSWKHVDGTHWHTRFNHLLTYGAGYYSYLYAKCFASTIWHKICKDDPLSLATGTALRTKLLQHGGAKDPAFLLNDLVGDGIIKYRHGGIVPDITSLCNEMNMVDS